MTNKQLTQIFNTLPRTAAQSAHFSIEWIPGHYQEFRVDAMQLGHVQQFRLVTLHDDGYSLGNWTACPLFDFNSTRWTSDHGYVSARFYGDTLKLTRYEPQPIAQS